MIQQINPVQSINAEINVPPSKSYTNRALIIAALADGTTTLLNPSLSDDSKYMTAALQELGIGVACHRDRIDVEGANGIISPAKKELFLGNAGTAMRFLAGFAGLIRGETILTGDEQMQRRPMRDLLEALRAAGVKTSSSDGYPPIKIHGGTFAGGPVSIKATVSSQFVSSLLLSAPYAKHPVTLGLAGKITSLPYIDMTLHVMRTFGGKVDVISPSHYYIYNDERYIGQEYTIEGDASSATYFGAAAAITGGTVRIANLPTDSLQGDIRFMDILTQIGCRVRQVDGSTEITGGHLHGIDIDMNEIPDCVPTLAVIAAFADRPTAILNIAQLKFKETNRIQAIASELTKLGVKVEVFDDSMIINPRPLRGATIETYNDHRIAMSFAVAGLRVPGIAITNPGCVSKSFPGFWEEFNKLQKAEG